MATYTYNTNLIEEAGLSLATSDMNSQPSSGNPPNGIAWSNQDLLALLLGEVLAGQALRFQTQILSEALASYPSASPTNQAVVLAKLGLSALGALSVPDQLPILFAIGEANFLSLSTTDRLAVFTALGLD